MSHRRICSWSRALVVAALLVSNTAGCGDDEPALPDSGADAGVADGGSEEPDGGFDMDAGEADAGPPDAGPPDAGPPDAGPPDAGPPDAGPPIDAGPRTLVTVSHPRELRAIWLATVSRLDFPSALGMSEAQVRLELTAIADLARASGLNAIFFQVRPESDALYRSTLDPWSRFLTGTQGVDPGWDPLAILLEIARPRGLEVHAWVNPYRALTSPTITPAANHVTQRFPSAAITYDGKVFMDPSDTAVRAHVVAVVTEIVREYDVDGVVFDDYFYPYPDGSPFPDTVPYQIYVDNGGTLSLLDWRRDNVNQLVSSVSTAIKTLAPWVNWGIAPFGIYRPGMPMGVTGLDAYNALAVDSVRWLTEGWVDYISPQLYWPTASSGQPFDDLVSWWADRAPPGRHIHPSLALHHLGSGPTWTASEFETQVALTRAEAPQTAGHVWFRYGMLADDADGERAMFARIYDGPARPPAVIETAADVVEPPFVTLIAGVVSLSHPMIATVRGYAVYRDVGGALELERWVPSTSTSISLTAGRWAISAIARGGAESPGVEVVVP